MIKEDRYYFKNENLFLWLDNNQEEQDLTTDTNATVGKELIAYCYKMINELKK
jgi:hypothetical protein